MLLEFRTKNYKSFTEETTFSLTPASRQTGLDYSVRKMQAGSGTYRGLCSAVLFGPNAAGKSNLIEAMHTFRSIVLRGNLNDAPHSGGTAQGSVLGMIPNCKEQQVPTEFSISFVDDGLAVEYSMQLDLGPFMAPNYVRKVLREGLTVNRKQVFLRNNTLTVNLPSSICHPPLRERKHQTQNTKAPGDCRGQSL